jgi:hypothetical protein
MAQSSAALAGKNAKAGLTIAAIVSGIRALAHKYEGLQLPQIRHVRSACRQCPIWLVGGIAAVYPRPTIVTQS